MLFKAYEVELILCLPFRNFWMVASDTIITLIFKITLKVIAIILDILSCAVKVHVIMNCALDAKFHGGKKSTFL